MKNPSPESLALAVAEGRASAEDRARVERDPNLAGLAAEFRRLLDALKTASVDSGPPEHLLHWARVWAREAAPRPATPVVSRLLEILAFGMPGFAPVRGMAAGGPAVLYGDERHQLDIRMEPLRDDAFSIRGQVVPIGDGGRRLDPWSIRLVARGGEVLQAVSDEDGVFQFPGPVDVDGMALIAERGTERLIVPRLVSKAIARSKDDDR